MLAAPMAARTTPAGTAARTAGAAPGTAPRTVAGTAPRTATGTAGTIRIAWPVAPRATRLARMGVAIPFVAATSG